MLDDIKGRAPTAANDLLRFTRRIFAFGVRRRFHHWEPAFRDKFGKALPASDLKFLLGTIHRFPDQWLIVSVIYPPKQPQQSLHLA